MENWYPPPLNSGANEVVSTLKPCAGRNCLSALLCKSLALTMMIVSLISLSIPAFCNRYTCTSATGGTTSVNGGAPNSYGGGTGSTTRTGSGTGNPVFSPTMNFTPTSVNCGGQTTFNFQLQGLVAEDSPATAILVVYSSASVTEINRPSSQHSVDNGYHDPETITFDGSGNKTFTSSGSHASLVQSPGASATYQLTPTASISGTGGASCSGQVSIKMQLFAVSIVCEAHTAERHQDRDFSHGTLVMVP